MQQKFQEKCRVLPKPPAAGGGSRGGKGGTGTSLISSAIGHAKGLATVLYGIQDSCGLLLPSDNVRRQRLMKAIMIKRALSPPPKRFNLRWRNFHPKPSRLSMMSTE
ncbi:hypothetical protein RND81_09G026000 [Saponaria officinalis]|uniref:Uncharacterized protein n=1 Tax=Saponaria officinalis TaxID=3572 RepID=A0AAW1IG37_SAPOF